MKLEQISTIFSNMAFFLDLKGENVFKIKAFRNASDVLQDKTLEELEQAVQEKSLTKIPGIGKGIAALIEEHLNSGIVNEYENLKKEFSPSLLELQKVAGLGPKKILKLYQELQVQSLAELEYACNENRLIDLQGFGEKSQEKIKQSLQQIKAAEGKILLPHALHIATKITDALGSDPLLDSICEVGELRRREPIISKLEFLLKFRARPSRDPEEIFFSELQKIETALPIRFYSWDPEMQKSYGEMLADLTGPDQFMRFVREKQKNTIKVAAASSEKEYFSALKALWVPPECRDFLLSGKQANEQTIKQFDEEKLIEEKNIRGIFHAHTKASDGANTLEEMASVCIEMGFEYLGISEHSQSAFYAGGLKEDAILRQREEIDTLNATFKNFKIFQGIESDIRKDGSLDYPDKILRQFDFVIASLHGNFSQPKKEITARVCRALENPYTTWLGHPTGRLLLGRPGADLDMDVVLETAAKNKKSMELNSNPYRLDLDWKYLGIARKKKISIGIFPDAHSIHGISDIKYGVWMARKAGLHTEDVVNTKTLAEMEIWLKK